LHNAGFREIEVHAVECVAHLASAAECLRFAQESFGALHQMMAGVPPVERDQIWTEIGIALRQFEGPDGFQAPCELLVGGATK
jgi:hypothetical protein